MEQVEEEDQELDFLVIEEFDVQLHQEAKTSQLKRKQTVSHLFLEMNVSLNSL